MIGGVKVGISICEDVWSPTGPLAHQAAAGAELNININGSPFFSGKMLGRERMLATRASDANCALVYVNQVCGQDELVFDGGSMVFDADGTLLARASQFVPETMIVDVDIEPVYRKRLLDPRGRITVQPFPTVLVSESPIAQSDVAPPRIADHLEPDAELYEALVLGTGDYIRKNGFTDVVIGLSGGIDSTLVACIAVDALGADHVHGVEHAEPVQQRGLDGPTRPTSPSGSASTTARSRSSRRSRAFLEMTTESFAGRAADLTEENLQSRIRGMTLMALSNKFGWMVLDHRQQERDGGRLLHDLRRQRRRVRRHQGRAEDQGLRPLPLRQPPRRSRDHQRERDHQAAVGRAPPGPARRPEPAARTSELDPILRLYVEEDRTAAEIVELGHPEDDRPPDHPARRRQRVQAPAVPARREGDGEVVRQGPPAADHQRLSRLRPGWPSASAPGGQVAIDASAVDGAAPSVSSPTICRLSARPRPRRSVRGGSVSVRQGA